MHHKYLLEEGKERKGREGGEDRKTGKREGGKGWPVPAEGEREGVREIRE